MSAPATPAAAIERAKGQLELVLWDGLGDIAETMRGAELVLDRLAGDLEQWADAFVTAPTLGALRRDRETSCS